MRDLRQSVVVITGGARGMGREYVGGFVNEGANIVALDLSWEPTGFSSDDDESFYQWVQAQENVLTVTADIASDEQIASAYQTTMDRFGTVEIAPRESLAFAADMAAGGVKTEMQSDVSRFLVEEVAGLYRSGESCPERFRNFVGPRGHRELVVGFARIQLPVKPDLTLL